MRSPSYVLALTLGFATFGSAQAQVPMPVLQQPVAVFSDEDRDWGVPPTSTPRRSQYHAPTPRSIPGARVIKTLELKALLSGSSNVVIVDVLGGQDGDTLPAAYWMPGAGDGNYYGAEKARFDAALSKVTNGDKTRPLVFLCISSECWLSYNAALYALDLGYRDVLWYRGGRDAWRGANLERKSTRAFVW